MERSELKVDKNMLDDFNIVWIFNIGAEKIWHTENIQSNDRLGTIITNRMEELNILLAKPNDIVILRNSPDIEYIKYLKSINFSIPNFLILNNTDENKSITELLLNDLNALENLKKISDKSNTLLVPYAVTELEEKVSQICNIRLWGPSAETSRMLNDKIIARTITEELCLNQLIGEVCVNISDLETTAERLLKIGFKKLVLKSPCNTSGQGMYVSKEIKEIKRFFQYGSAKGIKKWILEGWYEDAINLNYQVYIDLNGDVNVISIKEQIMDGVIYRGSLCSEIVYKENAELIHIGRQIGAYLYKKYNYTGIVGIDAIKSNALDDKKVYPIVEINARFTLSTYLYRLEKKMKQNVMYFYYKDLYVKELFTYDYLVKILDKNNLLYTREKEMGIIPLISATLPSECGYDNYGYIGRLFMLILANNCKTVRMYIEELDLLLNKTFQ